MKRFLALLCSVSMSFGLCHAFSPVKAAEETKGIIYYNIQKVKVSDPTKLLEGKYFLSTDGTLSDPAYKSAEFPAVLNARIEVAGPLDQADDYYGKSAYGEGYPVNVINADRQFDSCDDGHFFASEPDANGEQLWRYFCNYGGAQNAGPYYLYLVDSTSYTASDMRVKLKDSVDSPSAVTANNLDISIETTINGQKTNIPVTAFNLIEVEENSNKDAYLVTIEMPGEVKNTYVTFTLSVPHQNREPEKKSPKTGQMMPMIGALLVGLGAVAACGVLERKKHSEWNK